MTIDHEKYKRKRQWIFLFIVNPNLQYHSLSINKRGLKKKYMTSLITILIQLSKK